MALLHAGGAANNRPELLRRLEQTRRMVLQATDRQTLDSLHQLAADIEQALRKSDLSGVPLKSPGLKSQT